MPQRWGDRLDERSGAISGGFMGEVSPFLLSLLARPAVHAATRHKVEGRIGFTCIPKRAFGHRLLVQQVAVRLRETL